MGVGGLSVIEIAEKAVFEVLKLITPFSKRHFSGSTDRAGAATAIRLQRLHWPHGADSCADHAAVEPRDGHDGGTGRQLW